MNIQNKLLKELNNRKDTLNQNILNLNNDKLERERKIEQLDKEIDLLRKGIEEENGQLDYLKQEIIEREITKRYLETVISERKEELEKLNLELESESSILNAIHKEKLEFNQLYYEIEFNDKSKTIASKSDIDRSRILESLSSNDMKQLAYKYPISIADMMRLAELTNDEILEWVNKGRIPGKIYKDLATDGKPLPRSLYVDQQRGKFLLQCHIRGIEPEKYEAFQSKKLELWETFIGNSIHIDFRITYPNLEKMCQFVITGENVQEMVAMLKGEKRKTASGAMNVQHSKCVSKPSGEPPVGSPDKYYSKINPESSKPSEYSPSINDDGAKLIQSLDLGDPYKEERSFWMKPGTIGATKNTYSYMTLICIGDVISGCERHDLHELFLYPAKSKDDIFDGKFIIKCLKDEDSVARWEIWKAATVPKPMCSITHSDIGYHYLVPADKVDGIGREHYREESQSKFKAKLT